MSVMSATRRFRHQVHSTRIGAFILAKNRTNVPRVASALLPAQTSTITA